MIINGTVLGTAPCTTRSRGFSLIELMIAIAIVGIIAGVAIPAVMENMMKSRRSDARSLLMQIQNREEAFFQNNRNLGYTTNFTNLGSLAASAIAAGSVTSENGYYTITFVPAATVAVGGKTLMYRLIATPIGRQDKDFCRLSIDQDGTKGFTVHVPTGATDVAERTAKANMSSCWGN